MIWTALHSRDHFAEPLTRSLSSCRSSLGRSKTLLMAASILVTLAPAARAVVIEYDYTGVITSADSSTGVAVGTPFSGTFTYDTSGPHGNLEIEGFSQINYGRSVNYPGFPANASGLTLDIGAQQVASVQGGIGLSIFDIPYPNAYGYKDNPTTTLTFSTENVDGGSVATSLSLSNPNLSVPPLLQVPGSLSLDDYPVSGIVVTDNSKGPQNRIVLYTGTIETLTPVPAPEPAYATLLGLFAAGWLARERRRTR